MSTSSKPIAAIDPREFDGADFQRNPFPLYQRLRDDFPCYQDRFHNRWILSRYDDIVAVFQDNERFDCAQYRPDGPYEFGKKHVFGPNILEYGNGAQHNYLRNIVADQFVGKKLETFIPMIEQIARELIDQISAKAAEELAGGFAAAGEVELVSQFCHQFPVRVISNMLGLPRSDEEQFVRWYQALIAGLGFGGEHLTRGIHARNEMWDYLDPLIDERTANPGEDLVSRIVTESCRGSA